ncbi:MAG TPA: sulfur carrier protein ThiS [bacterium]|nr:sulfur carrier protein ThiS [bacterium]HOL48067.1 sulfur carrier protein ThiS [bacterium]HPQ17998.1 sulfur carrier protein ThiS [bacterium]
MLDKKIKIKLNGEDFFIEENLTVFDLLNKLKITDKWLAIQKNNEIIKREDYNEIKINQDDVIEIIKPFGGG